uniref:Calmodulin-like protein n=1 Tax=Ditylenchus dipsaci TaxID=166011 RepID=A0A915EPC3_9BILA
MAHHFTAHQIDEFRQCFELYADNGVIRNEAQLRYILRSLGGYQPTVTETKSYINQHDHHINMENFLEILQKEGSKGDPIYEVKEALRGLGNQISRHEIIKIIGSIGEKMPEEEVESLLEKMNLKIDPKMSSHEFLKQLSKFC